MDPLVGPVDLVDHHDDPVAQLQGLAEDEAGLGHGALRGVHQQDDAVDHLQDALHLAAKVGVARGVHNIDFHAVVLHGGVLGHDGDAPLPLQVVGVHDPLHGGLVLPVDAALLEHLVHQRGLAVVHVGDDGDVSQVFVLHSSLLLLLWQGHAGAPHDGARRAADQQTQMPCQPPDFSRRWGFAHNFALYAVLSSFASHSCRVFQKNPPDFAIFTDMRRPEHRRSAVFGNFFSPSKK